MLRLDYGIIQKWSSRAFINFELLFFPSAYWITKYKEVFFTVELQYRPLAALIITVVFALGIRLRSREEETLN